ncbi:MAG TPA: hypothetical protein VNT33_10175 [Telluria sp.]|nr:hypothetical protein [Telluria sp.]
MHLRISWKYVAAFLVLNGVVSELHEQAHITTGRLISGCYGPRDFNVWEGCASGSAALPFAAPLAGPLFSYLVMWWGAWLLLRGRSAAMRSVGFSLVFAPLPFARVFTALMGGGDERMVLARLLGDALGSGALRWLAVMLALAFCAPPVVAAWRALSNRHRGWYVAGFCVLPLIVIWIYKFKLLNTLLADGLLADPVLLGTPALVLVVFAGMCALTVLWKPWLEQLEARPAHLNC